MPDPLPPRSPLPSWEEALERTLAAVGSHRLPTEPVALTDAVGRTLAEPPRADRPSPPFDKAMMDGFALRIADWPATGAALPIAGERAAGPGQTPPLPPKSALRIMTGAPVPPGADAVVPVERTAEAGDAVAIAGEPPQPGANILREGCVTAAGEVLVAAGTRIAPRHLAALAEFGHAELTVRERPRVAIIATGDELVPHDQTPGPGQIRNSNAPMLAAQIAACDAVAEPLGIAADDRDDLAAKIEAGLARDVLLLSGGVSAGAYDLVPDLLAAAGVRKVLHKVAVKPGKPLWVGVRDDGRKTIVLGLPGNPVSSFVCFEVFARPVLRRLVGDESPRLMRTAPLTAPHRQKGDRATFWPARQTGDGMEPLPWQGSADLVRLAAADVLMIVPPGDRTWDTGEGMEYVSLG